MFYKSRESGLAVAAVTFFTVLKNWPYWLNPAVTRNSKNVWQTYKRIYLKNIGEKEVLKTRKKPQRLQLGHCHLYFYISLIKKITRKYVIVVFLFTGLNNKTIMDF